MGQRLHLRRARKREAQIQAVVDGVAHDSGPSRALFTKAVKRALAHLPASEDLFGVRDFSAAVTAALTPGAPCCVMSGNSCAVALKPFFGGASLQSATGAADCCDGSA